MTVPHDVADQIDVLEQAHNVIECPWIDVQLVRGDLAKGTGIGHEVLALDRRRKGCRHPDRLGRAQLGTDQATGAVDFVEAVVYVV